MEIKCKSGLVGWQKRLCDVYANFNAWANYDQAFGLAAKLGFASAREAWDANPLVQGSTIPDDYCRVHEHLPVHVKVIVELQVNGNHPIPEWKIRQSAEQAVLNAIEIGDGFMHDHIGDLSIGLISVETAGNEMQPS